MKTFSLIAGVWLVVIGNDTAHMVLRHDLDMPMWVAYVWFGIAGFLLANVAEEKK